MSKVVLDASALIALIFEEKGMNIVEKHLPNSEISAVNLSEVIAYVIKKGIDSNEITKLLDDLSLDVIDFTEEQAIIAGRLISKTASKGLSFGDRACLALAKKKNHIALTADRAWGALDLDIQIELLR